MSPAARLPLVAVTTCLDRGVRLRPGRDYVYVARAYGVALRQAGALPIFTGPDADPDELVERVDALVITGGDDLPRRMQPWSGAGATDQTAPQPPLSDFEVGARGRAEDLERIAFDRHLLAAFERAQKPVLGVCYGMQLMNVHFGGSLHLDLRQVTPRRDETGATEGDHIDHIDHGGGDEVTNHDVTMAGASALLSGLSPSLTVNSCHRQAVDELAPGFTVVAQSPDGVIEAFERAHLFGVQWHPETDRGSALVWRNFVRQCA